MSSSETALVRISESLFLFFCCFEFRAVFSSMEWFGTEFQVFVSILFHGTEFQAFFSYAERFGMNSDRFMFRRTAGIPTEQTSYSIYSVFGGIIFLSKIANPT
jgi:hypothetical protein